MRKEDLESFLQPVSRASSGLVPYLEPPSEAEIERRRALFAETMRLRDEIGPIGITTSELIRQGRREEEESYG